MACLRGRLLTPFLNALLSLLLQLNGVGPALAGPGAYVITADRRAVLNTIRYAEGTWVGGSVDGYHLLYGGGHFDDLTRHPDISVRRRYVSAAAGAYQFLPSTWKDTAQRLRLRDFGAASQDQAALHLIERRGVLAAVDRGAVDAQALARLAPEWASLPSLSGASYYGQPVKRSDDLLRFYRQQLADLKA